MLATYAYGRPGTYSVRLTVGDNRHGTGNVSLSITVRPILVVTLSATPEHGLVPLTVTVTSLPSGGVPPYEFLWDFGDATLNSFQNGSHIYPNPGPYPVTVSVTDSQGRLATRTVQVVVDPRTSLLQPWHAVQVILGLVVAIVILACAVVFMLCVRKRTRDSKVIR